jgi:hypothetical protein
MKPFHLSAFLVAAACALPVSFHAQATSSPGMPATPSTPATLPTPRPERADSLTPVKVQVVLSRYQGDKKISSLPYTLAFNVVPDRMNLSNLRMGAKIPIKMMSMTGGEKVPVPGPVQYQDVGTNIDCRASALSDGRYNLELTVEDTSVYAEASEKQEQPSFRSFRATNSMVMRDGQTGQFTSAVDKVSGEITRIDVTFSVSK